MWNIGFGELAVICIVLIIAVGPERLPSMMKTVGKTVRTLRQASRDLRESTGIDELLREDFDYRPPVRRPEPPAGPFVAREPEPVISAATSPMAGISPAEPVTPAATEPAASLPSDGPLTAPHDAHDAHSAHDAHDAPAEPPATAVVTDTVPTTSAIAEPIARAEHANVAGTLPSDAPLAAKTPSIPAPPPAGPLSVPPPAAAPVPAPAPANEAKPRES